MPTGQRESKEKGHVQSTQDSVGKAQGRHCTDRRPEAAEDAQMSVLLLLLVMSPVVVAELMPTEYAQRLAWEVVSTSNN